MSKGPGKYDAECAKILLDHDAQVVAVIVLGGRKGSSFSVNCRSPEQANALPKLLREMADSIEGVS